VFRDAGFPVHVQGPATFGTGSQDVDWLPKVGARRWVLITKDKNIRKRAIEVRALVESGVRAFVFTGGGMRGEDQGIVFRTALPAILRMLARIPPPFIARVTSSGDVERIDADRYLKT